MYTFYGILLTLSLFIFGYLCLHASKVRNRWTSRKAALTADVIHTPQHYWNELVSDVRYRCSICQKLGGGLLGSKIIQCTICGVVRHHECHQDRATACKLMIFSGSSSKFGHQWRPAIYKSKACEYCAKRCNANDFKVLHCFWCQRTVHEACSAHINENCDFGPLEEAIIFPSEVSLRKKQATDSTEFDFDLEFQFKNPKKCPIIAIVNKRSGGSLGEEVLAEFYQYLNPIQVIDLVDEGFDRLLHFKKLVPNMKIIVGGGDGTIGSTLDYIKNELQKGRTPSEIKVPVAVLPLGRMLGWGQGSSNPNVKGQILDVLYTSEEVIVDRWHVKIERFVDGKSVPILEKTVNNYVGVGIDAKVTLAFHDIREAYPNVCRNLFFNKVLYGLVGVVSYFRADAPNFDHRIRVYCNDQLIPIRHARGVVIQNVLTWSGGVKELFGETRRMRRAQHCGAIINGSSIDPSKYRYPDNFKRQSVCDGLIEGITLTSTLHIGFLQLKLAPGDPLCQGSKIVIECLDEKISLPIQTDGEPFSCQGPFKVTVDRCQKTMMLGLKGQIRTEREFLFLSNNVSDQSKTR